MVMLLLQFSAAEIPTIGLEARQLHYLAVACGPP
jgi:hypothetical protein